MSNTPTERMYQLLVRPLVTEKTTKVAEDGNWLSFEVLLDATKPEIKAALQRLYGVDVLKVNTLIQKGKTKRFRGRPGKRNDVKKAVVTLEEGQSIDITTGL